MRDTATLMTKRTHTEFLNVDLVLRHRSGLRRLIRALASHTIVLNAGKKGFAALEPDAQTKGADGAIRRFIRLIEALPRGARSIWDRCTTRRFDVGIQAGREPYSAEFRIARRSIEGASRIGAEIAVTVYGSRANDVKAARPGRRRKPPLTGLFASGDPELGEESKMFVAKD